MSLQRNELFFDELCVTIVGGVTTRMCFVVGVGVVVVVVVVVPSDVLSNDDDVVVQVYVVST